MKHKSLLMGVVIVLCVTLGMALPSFAQYTLSLAARDTAGNVKTQLAQGESFYLAINLNNAQGVAGCAFTLTYPANVLSPPEIDANGLPVNSDDITSAFPFTQSSTPTHRENSAEAGKIYFAGAEINPTTGGAKYGVRSIRLFRIKLKVKETAADGKFSLVLTQTELFNPAAGYGQDNNTNGVYDEGVDTKGKVPVLVGAVANTDPKWGGDLNDDFPILMGDQSQALASLQLNVLGVDTDQDGLSDSVETNTGSYNGPTDTGTDPNVADTDGDGLNDGQEVLVYSTNPLNLDTDGDGLTDGQEVASGRNPTVKDNVFGLSSAVIGNTYLPLDLGKRLKFTGTGTLAGYGRYIESAGADVIDTVKCLKVLVKGNGNDPDPDKDQEWSYQWIAQDTTGSVWLFQEYVDVSGVTETMVYGKDGAILLMPATPVEGMIVMQAEGEYGVVEETGVTVDLSTGLGPFGNSLKIKFHYTEPAPGGTKDIYFAPGVGIVKEEWNDGDSATGWELEEVVYLSGEPDFNADGQADVLWRDATNGVLQLWVMNGTTKTSTGTPGAPGLVWDVEAVADFNADGRSDILLKKIDTGELRVWLMNGATRTSWGSPGAPPLEWKVEGVADFNADGRSDILLRKTDTGELRVWLMNGATRTSWGSPGVPALVWEIEGIADFNADGNADILLRRTDTGEARVWLMDGATRTLWGSIGSPGLDWKIDGIGDFNADGKADILWRNNVTGQIQIWLMNGVSAATKGATINRDVAWGIGSVADFSNDGKADILWRNTTTGQAQVWLMNGVSAATKGATLVRDVVWGIGSVADFSNDGKADILWRNTTSGALQVWLMDGVNVATRGADIPRKLSWEIR
jgi:hypothetical protein